MNQSQRSQEQLFDAISRFAVNSVLEMVAVAYDNLPFAEFVKPNLPSALIGMHEIYFNQCAAQVYNRTDAYINREFDAMLNIRVPLGPGCKPYDPIDLLHIIVPMCARLHATVAISDLATTDREHTLSAVKTQLTSLANEYGSLAQSLTGCNCNYDHEPVQPGEQVFTMKCTGAVFDGSGKYRETNWYDMI